MIFGPLYAAWAIEVLSVPLWAAGFGELYEINSRDAAVVRSHSTFSVRGAGGSETIVWSSSANSAAVHRRSADDFSVIESGDLGTTGSGVGGKDFVGWSSHTTGGTQRLVRLNSNVSVVNSRTVVESIADSGGDSNRAWYLTGSEVVEFSTADLSEISRSNPGVGLQGVGGDQRSLWGCSGSTMYEMDTDTSAVIRADNVGVSILSIGGPSVPDA